MAFRDKDYHKSKSGKWYDLMQVCENGHKITAFGKSKPEDLVERCPQCGAPTITKCKNCGAEIPGHKHIPGVARLDLSKPPEYCTKCGKPFPWIDKRKEVYKISDIPAIHRIQKLLSRFPIVCRQLKNRHSDRPTFVVEDEYDVQDLIHALLKIEFDDIRSEEWTPSYGGAAARMDFLLKNERIVIETKKTRNGLNSKEIGEQLLIDIAKYKTHPDCKTLICFVYDPEGRIENPKGLKNDLESKSSKDLKILVYIYPI